MKAGNRNSILAREIALEPLLRPLRELISRYRLAECLAFLCVSVLIIEPLFTAVPAVRIMRFDYQIFARPLLFRRTIFPIAALLSALSLLTYAISIKWTKGTISRLARANPAWVFMLMTTVWMLISVRANWWDGLTLFWVSPTREETLAMQFGYFLLLLPAGALVGSAQKKTMLVRLHLTVSMLLVAAGFVLWNHQAPSTQYEGLSNGFQSIFVNINFYGYYLTVSISLAAAEFTVERSRAWQIVALGALILNTVALGINNTFGGWVASTCAMIFLTITRYIVTREWDKRAIAASLIFLVALLATGAATGNLQGNLLSMNADFTAIAQNEGLDSIGSSRGRLWRWSLTFIGEHPLFGIGFEGVALPPYVEAMNNFRPHNEYLQYALFYGVPAGFTYFSGCLTFYLHALAKKAHMDAITHVCLTGAFGYLVGAFFGLTTFCTAPYLFLFLGMGYVRGSSDDEDAVSDMPRASVA